MKLSAKMSSMGRKVQLVLIISSSNWLNWRRVLLELSRVSLDMMRNLLLTATIRKTGMLMMIFFLFISSVRQYSLWRLMRKIGRHLIIRLFPIQTKTRLFLTKMTKGDHRIFFQEGNLWQVLNLKPSSTPSCNIVITTEKDL